MGPSGQPATLSGEAAGPAIRTRIVDEPDALEKLAKALAREKAFAFDTETTSVSPREAELAGMSFAWTAGEGYYVPLKGLEADRCLPLKKVIAALRPVLESPKRLLVGQNVK
jgi:DNA polymerase-1